MGLPYGYNYILRHTATISTAITFLQLKAGTTRTVVITGAQLTQDASTSSAQESVALVIKSVAATVTTAVAGTHVFKTRTTDPTTDLSLGTAATGVIGSAEGTNGDIKAYQGFNVLTGWSWPKAGVSELVIPVSGIIAMVFLAAPASHVWFGEIHFTEVGG